MCLEADTGNEYPDLGGQGSNCERATYHDGVFQETGELILLLVLVNGLEVVHHERGDDEEPGDCERAHEWEYSCRQ